MLETQKRFTEKEKSAGSSRLVDTTLRNCQSLSRNLKASCWILVGDWLRAHKLRLRFWQFPRTL